DRGGDASEGGELGGRGGDGNGGFRGRRGEADGFEGDRLAAGVGAADHHNGFAPAERERRGNGFAALRRKRVLQDGIADVFEEQRIGIVEGGHGAIELAGEAGGGKNGGGVRRAVRATGGGGAGRGAAWRG